MEILIILRILLTDLYLKSCRVFFIEKEKRCFCCTKGRHETRPRYFDKCDHITNHTSNFGRVSSAARASQRLEK